ncbi:hypothetical protein LTS17_004109 [Exophiala oligosperma]
MSQSSSSSSTSTSSRSSLDRKIHPDFSCLEWCKVLLSDPDIENITTPTDVTHTPTDPKWTDEVSNSMFVETLYTPRAIRAQISFTRPRPKSEVDAVGPTVVDTVGASDDGAVEYCSLFSLGPGVDGKTGRAHGGLNALLLDQLTGGTAAAVSKTTAPATATMTVDYKNPISTPGVVFGRAWAVERSGRKTWVKAVIEDGKGKVLAAAKALFIDPRPVKTVTTDAKL